MYNSEKGCEFSGVFENFTGGYQSNQFRSKPDVRFDPTATEQLKIQNQAY